MSSGISQRKTYSDYSTYLKKRASNTKLNEAIKFYEKTPSTRLLTCTNWKHANNTETLRKIRINWVRTLVLEAMRTTQTPGLETIKLLLDGKKYDINFEGFNNFINREYQVDLKTDPDILCLASKVFQETRDETALTNGVGLFSNKYNRRQLVTAGDTYYAVDNYPYGTLQKTVKVNSFDKSHILRGPVTSSEGSVLI